MLQARQGGLRSGIARGYGLLGAVEIQQPHVGQPGSNHQFRRIARHAAARDAHLHDVDTGHRHIQQRRNGDRIAGRGGAPGAPPPQAALQARHPGRAVRIHHLRRLAGRLVGLRRHHPQRVHVTVQQAGVQIHGDDDVRPHGARQRGRHRVDQAAIGQQPPLAHHRGEQARHRDRGPHRVGDGAMAQPDLGTRMQVGGHGGKRQGRILDVEIREIAAPETDQLLALEHAARQVEVHEAEDIAHAQALHPVGKPLQLAGGIGRADQGTDRGATDHIGADAGFVQRLQHTNVRPAACRATAQRQSNLRGAPGQCHAQFSVAFSRASMPASSSTGTPSSWALASLLPASAPAIT